MPCICACRDLNVPHHLSGSSAARCQHNQVYWAASQPYHAFGLGASSLVGARRFARPRSMRAYRAWVEGFTAAGDGVPGAHLDLHGCPIEGLLTRPKNLSVCTHCKIM